MLPEEVLAHEPRALTQAQREFYFQNGWLARLRAATEEMVDRSRALTRSDRIFDLEPGHTADEPRLRRLTSPVDHHPEYWAFASESVLPDIMADLVGPDVKFHHSKLNFKWAKGGEEVKWHQDITYWPHTNYSPLTAGLYLYDCGPEQGPLMAVPGTHDGELFSQYDDTGNWVVHGSRPNRADLGRPLLLNVYSAADAFPYTANPLPSSHAGEIVRGEPALWAYHDPRPCLVPPDWSRGYTSLFALQQKEKWEDVQAQA
jgi:ectoine hydroxylase